MILTRDNSLTRNEAAERAKPYRRYMIWAFLFIAIVGQMAQLFDASRSAAPLTQLGNMLAAICWYFATAAWLNKGYAFAMLKIVDGYAPYKSDLFIGRRDFTRSLAAVVVVFIKTILWCMLLLVPGFIAWFKYSMTFFVLNERPDLSGAQCVRESSRLMRGNKMKLFKLLFYYFLTFVLVAIALDAILYGLLSLSGIDSYLAYLLASVVAFICAYIVYNIRAYPAMARFYRLISVPDNI